MRFGGLCARHGQPLLHARRGPLRVGGQRTRLGGTDARGLWLVWQTGAGHLGGSQPTPRHRLRGEGCPEDGHQQCQRRQINVDGSRCPARYARSTAAGSSYLSGQPPQRVDNHPERTALEDQHRLYRSGSRSGLRPCGRHLVHVRRGSFAFVESRRQLVLLNRLG